MAHDSSLLNNMIMALDSSLNNMNMALYKETIFAVNLEEPDELKKKEVTVVFISDHSE